MLWVQARFEDIIQAHFVNTVGKVVCIVYYRCSPSNGASNQTCLNILQPSPRNGAPNASFAPLTFYTWSFTTMWQISHCYSTTTGERSPFLVHIEYTNIAISLVLGSYYARTERCVSPCQWLILKLACWHWKTLDLQPQELVVRQGGGTLGQFKGLITYMASNLYVHFLYENWGWKPQFYLLKR